MFMFGSMNDFSRFVTSPALAGAGDRRSIAIGLSVCLSHQVHNV